MVDGTHKMLAHDLKLIASRNLLPFSLRISFPSSTGESIEQSQIKPSLQVVISTDHLLPQTSYLLIISSCTNLGLLT